MATGNATWACFDCRLTVRRPTQYKGLVPCLRCGGTTRCLGTKIPVPSKKAADEWRKLEDRLRQSDREAMDWVRRNRVRRRHQLEKRIADLRLMPTSPKRTQALKALEEKLSTL